MYKRRFSWVQACWLLIAVFLSLGGVVALLNRDHKLIDEASLLGILMFCAGAFNLLVCHKKSHQLHGAHWLMADGLTAVMLAIYPLFNEMTVPNMVPFFFCVWELFSGILKILDTIELKDAKIHCWKGFAIIGFVELISGATSMIKPFDDLVGIHEVIAMIFFIQSAGFLLKVFMFKYLHHKN